jgi:UPF0176 protein
MSSKVDEGHAGHFPTGAAGSGAVDRLPTIRAVTIVLNVSAYRFVDIADPEALRATLTTSASSAALMGTVLIAPEGINLFLAGEPGALRGWLARLREDPRFADLAAKESFSSSVPFRHLRVKVKCEIIRMNEPSLRPAAGRAPTVDAATLVRWLEQGHCEEGRPLRLLDTRNAFEVDAGAFEGALDWRLGKFSDFPAALEHHRAELEGHTVVSYCTGGIRCEKAALLMRERDLPHVLQLDGGILKYFEETTGAPGWRGECFVFDQRETLDSELK